MHPEPRRVHRSRNRAYTVGHAQGRYPFCPWPYAAARCVSPTISMSRYIREDSSVTPSLCDVWTNWEVCGLGRRVSLYLGPPLSVLPWWAGAAVRCDSVAPLHL